jgi:hypothetical protein
VMSGYRKSTWVLPDRSSSVNCQADTPNPQTISRGCAGLLGPQPLLRENRSPYSEIDRRLGASPAARGFPVEGAY